MDVLYPQIRHHEPPAHRVPGTRGEAPAHMVINQRVEQGIYVVLILSLEKDHRALRSTELSEILSVSDSYLKKILRQLVVAGIVASNPGKEGGFQLARMIDAISVYDVYAALEGAGCELRLSGIGERLFVDGEKFNDGQRAVVATFHRANEAFCDELRKLRLAELLSEKHYAEGTVEFEALLGRKDVRRAMI